MNLTRLGPPFRSASLRPLSTALYSSTMRRKFIMSYNKMLLFLVFLYPVSVRANPNMFGGGEILFIAAAIFFILIIFSIIGLAISATKKSPKRAFSFLMLPPCVVGILMLYSAQKCCGHFSGPGTVRDIFLFLSVPGVGCILASVLVYFKRYKKITG